MNARDVDGKFVRNAYSKFLATKGMLRHNKGKWVKLDGIAEIIYGEHEWPECYDRSIAAMIKQMRDDGMVIERQDKKVRFNGESNV